MGPSYLILIYLNKMNYESKYRLNILQLIKSIFNDYDKMNMNKRELQSIIYYFRECLNELENDITE